MDASIFVVGSGSGNSTLAAPTTTTMIDIPQWMIDAHSFRQQLFLRTIEPIIVLLLGPVVVDNDTNDRAAAIDSSHRRWSFLPSWVENPNYSSNHTSMTMTFATLTMMYIIMSVILLVFLSCFYHNQKTSPLFVSPRRHRLPKLVPPPLPVDGAFSWMKVCLLLSDEEVSFNVILFVMMRKSFACCFI